MSKQILFILTFFLALSFCISAQSLEIATHGISPRDAETDSVENYFDRAYNGLLNVGIETQMYLRADMDGAQLTNPVWTILEKPASSVADFGDIKNIDTSSQVVKFVPDLRGTYKVSVASGSLADTVTINAGFYLGVEGGGVSCKTCHSETYNQWVETNHFSGFERAINADNYSPYYNETCVPCHTTGFDEFADNQGFDEYEFEFPDSLYMGAWDQLMTQYPEAMEKARVQCESCHGPGSDHMGQTANNKMQSTLSSDNCAKCHDSGTHHLYPEQWDVSVHASGNHLYAGSSRAACTPCHNGKGFIDKLNGEEQNAPVEVAITCATCHDPHDATNKHQIRTVSATLLNGVDVNIGAGSLCSNCHQSRQNGVEYTNDYLNNLSSRFGPHHGPQTDILLATNVPTFGKEISSSPHAAAIEDGCVGCHMFPGKVDESGAVMLSGSHSFRMVTPDGVENTAACADCHGEMESFADKKFYVNGNADLDGNGTAEGLPTEVHGLLEILAEHLPPYGSTDINTIDSTWSLAEAQALYNYTVVEEDRSGGIHNPQFVVGLLYASIEAVGGIVSVDTEELIQPMEFNLAQNYPNPFNPTTKISYSVAERANVHLTIYDALGRQIETLVDEQKERGNYEITWDASRYASGVYFYNITAGNFVSTKKMLLVK